MSSGGVLTFEEFMSHIKVEETEEKEMRQKEDRKRKKDEQVSNRSSINVKKSKVYE